MAPLSNTVADAVDRETAWLRTHGDTLPALLAEHGGPFDVVQAYFPRTPATESRCLYVMRQRIRPDRIGGQRMMNTHAFLLRISWPARDGDGEVEKDQRALDNAVAAVLARVDGFVGDKTHGGRFLSVAEGQGEEAVTFIDPSRTLLDGVLLCDITYSADDPQTVG